MNDIWLAHHGIKGQKWGVRRFENPDGSLTEAGKKRYGKSEDNKEPEEKFWTDKKKKVVKGAAYVLGTALVAYGGLRFSTSSKVQSFIVKCINKFSKKNRSSADDPNVGRIFNTKTGKYLSEEESDRIIQKFFEEEADKIDRIIQKSFEEYHKNT